LKKDPKTEAIKNIKNNIDEAVKSYDATGKENNDTE